MLGSLTGDPSAAVPISAISRFWWAGAEALDDLIDQDTDQKSLLAAIPCLTLFPQVVITQADVSGEVREFWRRELVAYSVHAAEGQLADLARTEITWPSVIRAYVGKTGAAYGGDAAMAARLVTADERVLHAWRSFGRMFGVLRQVHNDNGGPEAFAEDIRNGTPTLLLAHALEVTDRPAELNTVRRLARRDPGALTELRRMLLDPRITSGYDGRLVAFRNQARDLLHQLAGPSHHRDVLDSMIDTSAAAALKTAA
ncbi:polyprenyl synthetase family protein [Lentzea sp. NBRC 105346]|uniref:polyprenyl synthetase family protein n=1 Tax=Lentzea sp. NBRC 105346 TaxID=3032205 RepID=UPI0025577C79|nr:polyprenyl synthetase family protein [Lentzea sp. NBRC 105346]